MKILLFPFIVILWILKLPLKIIGMILTPIFDDIADTTIHTGIGDIKPLYPVKILSCLTAKLRDIRMVP